MMKQCVVPSKKFFDKSYDGINIVVERLSDYLAERDPEGKRKRIIVAIARKGPHFEDVIKESLMGKGLEADFVSDIAIPFVDFAPYDEVIVLDDAVYYGTTFRKVSMLVRMAIERSGKVADDCDVIGWPLVVKDGDEDIINPESVIDGQVCGLVDRLTYVKEENVPFYVNTVIDFIQRQRKPYDVEIPVFNLKVDKVTTSSEFVKELCHSISSAFGVQVPEYVTGRYNRMDRCYMSTYVVLLDDVFKAVGGLNPDISKLKLIFKTDENGYVVSVSFAAYCINTMNDAYLSDGKDLFSAEVVDGIWTHISEVRKVSHDSSMKNRAEYVMQSRKSLAILANWVYSVFMAKTMMMIAGIYDRDAFVDGVAVGLRVLCGITDSDRAAEIACAFAVIDFNVYDRIFPASSYRPISYITVPYRIHFEQEWYDVAYRSGRDHLDVDQCMSVEFSALHRLVEMPSRKRSSNVFRRLEFGESISGMCERYSLAAGHRTHMDKIRFDVNRGLDLRVDAGSIVPTYALQHGANAGAHWVRLFRPGENDDIARDQFVRNFFFLVRTIMGLSNVYSFNRHNFINRLIILSVTAKTVNHDYPFLLLGSELRHYWNDKPNEIGIIMKTCDGGEVDLMKYAEDCGALTILDGNNYKLTENDFTRPLMNGNLFDENMESLIVGVSHDIRLLEERLFGPVVELNQIVPWYVWNRNDAISDAETIVNILSQDKYEAVSEQFTAFHSCFYKISSLMPLFCPDLSKIESDNWDESAGWVPYTLLLKVKNNVEALSMYNTLINVFRMSYVMESRFLFKTDGRMIRGFADSISDDFDPLFALAGSDYHLSEIWRSEALLEKFDTSPVDIIRDLNCRVVDKAKNVIAQLKAMDD